MIVYDHPKTPSVIALRPASTIAEIRSPGDVELQMPSATAQKSHRARREVCPWPMGAKRKKEMWRAKRAVICEINEPLPTGTQYDVILADPPTDHIPSRTEVSDDADRRALPASRWQTRGPELGLVAVGLGRANSPGSANDGGVGFKFTAQMVWDKERPGTGSHVRYRHENLFIGTRGHPAKVPLTARPEPIHRSVSGKHSAKPTDAYLRIEQMFPRASKVELSCRGEPRDGWTGWGNQCIKSQPTRDGASPAIEVIKVKEMRQTEGIAACNEASLAKAA